MLALVVVGSAGLTRVYAAGRDHAPADAIASVGFPAQLGSFRRARTWDEFATAGPLIYQWADYAPPANGIHIALGISPILGSHDTLICHSARGEDPLWHAQFTTDTGSSAARSFSASFFNDGATQYLEVTTICNSAGCGEYSTTPNHLGLVYSRPSASALFSRDPQRPIPVILRAETIDTTMPAEVARQQLTAAMREFLRSLDLPQLTGSYRSR
jgi:exosortase J